MKAYTHRIIEKEIKSALSEFPVLVLTGPRQTGKSTLLTHILPDYSYCTFDDPMTRKLASEDPKLFLSRSPKMIIDEIQYAPELLPYIKIEVDRHREANGHYVLTGSQYFPLMAGISESLAGRAVIYELLGFSMEEFPAPGILCDIKSCFASLFRGFYPELVAQGVDRNRFYSSYLRTYIERDIRQITSVHDLKIFQDFLELLAGRAGSILNLNEISKEVGISFTSARRWLSLLETTRIVYLLRPYTRNKNKWVVKRPKLYFTDTGLLSYLLRYPDPQTMQTGPQAGAFFENFILTELLKYKFNHNLNFELYFYRDSNHNEIDLVLDYGLSVKLLEIKASATIQEKHVAQLKTLLSDFKKASAYLVSFSDERHKMAQNVETLPCKNLLEII